MRWLDPLALLLFPAACEECGAPLRPAADQPWILPRRLCPDCLAGRLQRASAPAWSLDGLPGRSLFWYEGEEARWLRRIKEGGQEGFLDQLARLWPRSPLEPGPSTLLVPVPADRLRARQRGGDHVARLTRRWAAAWGLEIGQLLERRGGAKQQGLGAGERRRNLAGQYQARTRAGSRRGAEVLLVDDVVTTGATLGLCRRLLEEQGLRVAGALTLACAPRPELRLAGLAELERTCHTPESEVHDAWPRECPKSVLSKVETFDFP